MRRMAKSLNRVSQSDGGFHARAQNLCTILRVVTAIHTSAGEIDYGICTFERLRPKTRFPAIPMQGFPRFANGRSAHASSQGSYGVAGSGETAGKEPTEMAFATGDDDA